MTLIIQPAERVLYSDTRAPTRSRASNAQDSFESFTLIGSSESSRENSDEFFYPFLSTGTTLVSKSAERLFYVASTELARRPLARLGAD